MCLKFRWKDGESKVEGENIFSHLLSSTFSGSYVYVESSKRNKGDRARLVSQMLGSKTRQCFSFYYNMYGKDTGTLRLFLAPEHKPWIYLFTKTGNQGQNWHNADVTLENNGNFQVRLLFFHALVSNRTDYYTAIVASSLANTKLIYVFLSW